MAEEEPPFDSKLNGRGDVGERAGVCRPALLIDCGLWYRKWEELISPSARKPGERDYTNDGLNSLTNINKMKRYLRKKATYLVLAAQIRS